VSPRGPGDDPLIGMSASATAAREDASSAVLPD
jgi:hypothetical protein